MTINNNNIFGAFTLNEARGSRLTGDWLNKEFVANYGWFGGGATPTTVATVDRIDFSNDTGTANIRGPLSLARYYLAATGNSNYGWFGGGRGPGAPIPIYSTVDRIDFSNDAATASPRVPLSLARIKLAATGNSNYGWFGGGSIPTPATYSTVDRIDFSNDSGTASVRGPLSIAKTNLASTGNSNYGWFGGGYASAASISTVDRIDFSNDIATASPRGPLSQARSFLAATGNSNYGWFGGGWIPGSASTVNRIDFSNDSSAASPRGSLIAARGYLAATGNSNYGWFGGGWIPGATGSVSTVDRIDFSNDSASSSPRGPLSSVRYGTAATSGVLNIRRQKAGNYGWFGGGEAYPTTSTLYATINRIDFSNDLPASPSRTSLSSVTRDCGATGNSDYGYWAGGETPFNTSKVDRLDFSNDSAPVSVRGPMTGLTYYVSATGNSNYGYFGGGRVPGGTTVSKMDRTNFANDSSTASPRGVLTAIKYGMATASNSNYGWWGGGTSSPAPGSSRMVTTVDRINFSNDLATASPRGPLSGVKYGGSGTGNSNYGWMSGGNWPSPGFVNVVERINYANDSVSVSVRGPLTSGRYMLAAAGNSNYGWWGGGRIPTPSAATNIVERINFSNDLAATSPRGALSISRDKLAATSNTTR